MPFAIKADGEYHAYRVDISHSNQLLMEDHILRLRLNPAEGNAEIEVKAIQVYTDCSAVQGEDCTCSPRYGQIQFALSRALLYNIDSDMNPRNHPTG